jgi:hypothetical protein
LNDDIFGRSARDEVVYLIGTSPEPAVVQTSIKDGKYYGAAVVYPPGVTLETVLQALRAKYAPYEARITTGQQRWNIKRKDIVVVAEQAKGRVEVFYLPAADQTQAFESLHDVVNAGPACARSCDAKEASAPPPKQTPAKTKHQRQRRSSKSGHHAAPKPAPPPAT